MIGIPPLCLGVLLVFDTSNDSDSPSGSRQLQQTMYRSSAICLALAGPLLTLILLTWRIWWAPNNASKWQVGFNSAFKGRYTLVTLPRNVTPYRDSVDGTCDHVTYQNLVRRLRYGLVRCAVGIWPSHQRDGTVTAWAGVDGQSDTSPPPAAPVTNWESQCVTLAGYCYAVRRGM